MNTPERLQQLLSEYLESFVNLADGYDGTPGRSSDMEQVIDRYSALITDEGCQDAWERLEREAPGAAERLAEQLRSASARCVAIMEKYRALKFLNGEEDRTDYFRNIESCIEQEFGSFHVAPESRVVMVGAGSFPMTPLLIAKRTGAEVTGIDIDEEAVELGRRVVEKLGGGLRIHLTNAFVEQLEMLQDATHIIFSSTVSVKYELLERLHSLTRGRVVAAMRYGDRIKSLFNYPRRDVDERKWRLVETVPRPGQVFDVALYERVAGASSAQAG